jgi:mono/diheme cytochrome c family protein
MKTSGIMTIEGMRPFAYCLISTICLFFSLTPVTLAGPKGEGATKVAEADEAAFRRGRSLSATECAGCHRAYRPAEYSPGEWPRILRKMGSRASLSENQIKDLETYFVTAASSRNPR